MKFKLLFFAVFLALASCSGDDSTTPVEPEVQEPVFKDINTITMSYTNVSGRLGNDFLTFENNKLVHYKMTGPSGLIANIYYEYSDTGLLTKEELYRYDDVLHTRFTMEYDAQGRITEKLYEAFDEGVMSSFRDVYTYNNDNTISSITYYYDGSISNPQERVSWSRVFYLNTAGQIYKIVWNTPTGVKEEEVIYDGGNVTSLNKYGAITTFTYDTEHLVQGQLINMYENQFGTYKPNIVLYENHFLFEGILNYRRVNTQNYILSETDGVKNYTYSYEFDNDNYPVKKALYNNGELYYNMQITYQ